MVVAGVFLFKGLWMALLFSALELAVLGDCPILAMKKSNTQEVTTITEKAVLVQCGSNEVENQEELQMG